MASAVSTISAGVSRSSSDCAGPDKVQRVLEPAGTTQNWPCRRTPWRSAAAGALDDRHRLAHVQAQHVAVVAGESKRPSGTGEVSTSSSGRRSRAIPDSITAGGSG